MSPTPPAAEAGSKTTYTVTASHLYIEDGTFAEKVILSNDGLSSTTLAASNNIVEAKITAKGGAKATATATLAFTDPAIATFVDANIYEPAGSYKATINWGDGVTSAGLITGSAGQYTVAATHTFAAQGARTAKITIYDGNEIAATASTAITVNSPSITAHGATLSGHQGRLLSGTVATFTAGASLASSAFTATVAWGDGTSSAGTVIRDSAGKFHVAASHAYAGISTGSGFPITVTIKETGITQVSVASFAKIANSPLDEAFGVSLTASLNKPLVNVLLGAFRDQNALSNSAANYTASIAWGDGVTSAATIVEFTNATPNLGSYWHLLGTHTYTKKGTFSVKITLHDNDAPTVNTLITTTIKVS